MVNFDFYSQPDFDKPSRGGLRSDPPNSMTQNVYVMHVCVLLWPASHVLKQLGWGCYIIV